MGEEKIPEPPDTPEQVRKKKLDNSVIQILQSQKVKDAIRKLREQLGEGDDGD